MKKLFRLELHQRWLSLGLRDKLLSFYTLMIVIVMVINGLTSFFTYRHMSVFNRNLTAFFDIHQLQLTVESNRSALETHLRTHSPESLAEYRGLVPRIWQLADSVERERSSDLESYFQMRATRRGLSAYFDLAERAVQKAANHQDDAYGTYVAAEHIESYVTGYISRLLSSELSAGSRQFASFVRETNRVEVLSFMALVVLGVLSVIFGVLFANSITRPIRRLAQMAAGIAGGNFDVGVLEVGTRDEVGVLSASFNTMSRSIQEMVVGLQEKAELEHRLHDEELTIVKMEKALQEAQFLGLQSQINPHFLFNTLNSISRTALFEHAGESALLIQSLSRLLRYNLRDASKNVPLREELEMLREYLSLQQHRFPERLQFEIRCSRAAERATVPCFSLQPFVENSVRHGIEPKEQGGSVSVDATSRSGRLKIRIQDTGIGMSRTELHALMNEHDDARVNGSEGAGIGIANVRRRMRLIYHGAESITIQSSPERGTVVTIVVPAEVIDG